MPHYWNEILVVTQSELEPWYTLKNLQQHIHRHKELSYGIKKVRCGGNGRQMLMSYDSLPGHIKNVLKDPREFDHILELYYQQDKDAAKYFQNYQFVDGSYLSLTHQEQYITNASVLSSILKLQAARIQERKSKGGSVRGLISSLANDAATFNNVLLAKHNLKHTLPSSEKRFKEALKEFQNNGYETIISKKHKNKNSKKMTDELLALLNSMFATQPHKPTRTEVARQYSAFLSGQLEVISTASGELFQPENFRTITDASIINWLGKWDNKIATYAKRSGNRQKFMQQFKPYHSLKQPKFAGSIISIDDRQPPFTYGNNKRVWFYNGIDLGSEAFTCWVYGDSKEGIILDFYRQMVRNYTEWGLCLPAELEGEMSLNSAYLDKHLKPGRMFDHVRIEANNARGKRIEAYFSPLRYQLEKKRVGWLARPFAARESNQAGRTEVPTVPFNTIINGSLKDLQTWNNMPHSKHPEVSRWEYFLQNQHPELKPINYKGIIPYIGFTRRTSCNAGIVKFNNSEFLLGDNGTLFFGDKLIGLMSRLEDQPLEVHFLDGNDGEIIKAYAFIGDQYICELIEKPKYHRATIEQTEDDAKNRELMSKYVATVEGYLKQASAQIEHLQIIDNRDVTISNSFKIRDLEGNFFAPEKTPPTQLDTEAVEVLVDPDEDEQPYIPTSTDLKDRF